VKWLKSSVEGAGLSGFGPIFVALAMFAVASLIGWIAFGAFGVVALGVFLGLGALAFQLEALTLAARSRRRQLIKLWPEIVESIHSAIVSGLSLPEAIDDLAFTGPHRVRSNFLRLSTRLDAGWSFDDAIDELKSEFGELHADRLCEVLRLVANTGSEYLAASLSDQATNLRKDLALAGQVEAKQGWVAGTAKIAVAAPWIVVALLSTRTENAVAYNSASGIAILFIGFVISLFAYRLVHLMGGLPESPRVFL
jgi:tight adherence protein B